MNDNFFGSQLRKKIFLVAIIGFISLLAFQLFQMQILNNPVYQAKSKENSIKEIPQTAARGVFYDRNFDIVVSNKPSFTLQIIPAHYNKELNPVLETALQVDSGYVSQILEKNKMYNKFSPRKIKRNVDFAVIAWLEENSENLPGVEYVVETQRDYSYGVSGAHLFGYSKEVSRALLEENKEKYSLGDYVGYNGIEKTYEDYLRGKKGVNYVLVDSRQRKIGEYNRGLNDKAPNKGTDLVLTIDAKTQRVAEEAFAGKTGALVAMEPSTGEIIALVSSPGYSLSDFASVTPRTVLDSLNKDEDKPLFNRATMSINPPGSTFKMLMAIAALEEGVITPNTYINCKGGYTFGRYFRCHGVHGITNVEKAIEKSCNTFFYPLVLKIGFRKWAEYARSFGFGEKTGIDIGEETRGIVPDPDYYDRVYGKNRWTDGYLISLGIGQGELSATPVQLAKYVSLIANYGKTKIPHVVKGYIDRSKEEFKPLYYDDVSVDISKRTFDVVRKGMWDVVQGEGTGRWIRMAEIEIAGKTGTAQNPHGEDHAQFVAFAPYDNPKIAVALIVENVGFGSTHAAPIARDVIKAYLVKDDEDPEENNMITANSR